MQMLRAGEHELFALGGDGDAAGAGLLAEDGQRRAGGFGFGPWRAPSGPGGLEGGPCGFELCEIEARLSSGLEDQPLGGL
jgi:hypothetical protein